LGTRVLINVDWYKIMIEKLNRSQAAALPMPSTSGACSE